MSAGRAIFRCDLDFSALCQQDALVGDLRHSSFLQPLFVQCLLFFIHGRPVEILGFKVQGLWLRVRV